uniref:Uncharacterized protein n=1 Tax=Pseudomonas phage HRDY3 TaxID=3236930 RepID=A0AB39CEK4_9VIRU
MPYPQKLILTKHQREVLLHRISHLSQLSAEEIEELFGCAESDDPLNVAALCTALETYDELFTRCAGGQLIAITVETREQAEALAEALEGSTFFATRMKGDGVYVHAAKAVAELLSTVLDREVEPHIDPRTSRNSV